MRPHNASASFGLAAALTLGVAGGARALDLSQLQGAWIQAAAPCEDAFSGTSFRRPVNIFTPAFIVSGERLSTPTATCAVRSGREVDDRLVVSLSCSNIVSEEAVTVFFGHGADGTITRFFSDRDTLGTNYKLCAR